jgi:succinyl-CoA synthetase beta subunit
MYLLEHDAKELLARHGIAVPAGRMIEREQTIDRPALPAGPWVVKGQIPAGGRGKAGIIKRAATLQEISGHANAILGATVKGHTVEAIRIEQQVAHAAEAYVGFLLDAASGGVRIIVSANGGMEIEQVPHDQIHTAISPPEPQALADCVRQLAGKLPGDIGKAVADAGAKLARAFLDLECLLVEINPLFVQAGGGWIAGDAKVVTDDNALLRQKELETLVKARPAAYPDVARKHEHDFDYVVVDPKGEIGLLTTGAGLSMMLIDEMRKAGLKPYNFLDIRTGALRGETTRIVKVLTWLSQAPSVRVLLVNIFGGIANMGEFSKLLVAALGEVPTLKVPVVARLVGNGLPDARGVLKEAGIELHTDLDAALDVVRQHLNRKS